jgi:CDP-2,3-bis-(O-geranylgeranyl)-sn-glycerol synthase
LDPNWPIAYFNHSRKRATVCGKILVGSRFNQAIDFDAIWTDGQPLLGRSKTIRGLVLSLVITAALAPVVGLPWIAGLLIADSAMAGDLLISFLKRRLAYSVEQQRTGN